MSSSHATTTLPTPATPVEVVERIIDFVAGTTISYGLGSWDNDVLTTLQACALVSRAWLLRCRHHLFRALGVRCAPTGERTIDDLRDLLGRHASLKPIVRALTASSGPSEVPKLHLVPMLLPSELPRLEHLHLCGGALYVPRQLALDAVIRQFATVSSLSVDNLGFYSVHDLRRVITGLSQLKALTINSPSWMTDSPARPPAPRYRPSPVRLTLLLISSTPRWTSDCRSVYFLNWLAHSGTVDQLEELNLRPVLAHDSATLDAVATLLDRAKSRLREVDVALGPDVDLSLLSTPLLAVANLTHLYLALPYTHTSFTHLLSILTSSTWKHLTQLSLTFITYPIHPSPPTSSPPPDPAWLTPPAFPAFPTDDDWAALDKALQSDVYKKLGKLVLGSLVRETIDAPLVLGWGDDPEGWLEEWVEEVKTGVPGMVGRGVVHVWDAEGEIVAVT